MLEPNAVVLYVNDLLLSSAFYQSLLGKMPEETSLTFHSFKLSNGMSLGLKAKHSVVPSAPENGGGELAFILDSDTEVDNLFKEWQRKKISISQLPTVVPYGYTFMALDPDGNRLRAVSLKKPSISSIHPVLKHMDSFTVRGFRVRTQNSDEFNRETAKLPNLWQQFYSSHLVTKTPIFGVYSDYESDANGLYTVTAGIVNEGIANDENKNSSELSAIKTTSGDYLIFHSKGAMPLTAIETWKRVWDYFTEDSTYQRCFMTDFETYSNSDEVAIYIGVK